jgi:GT2 family glycosyltransferase
MGVQAASHDVIVFTDAHINVPRRWWNTMVELLDDPSIAAAAPSISVMGETKFKGFGLHFKGADLAADWLGRAGRDPYAVPILPGCCMAIRRDVLDATGGPDDGMLRCGGIDNEFCLRLWLLGYRLMIVPDIEVEHLFGPRDYPLKWRTVVHNRLRLAFIHFGRHRIRQVVEALKETKGFVDGLSLTVGTDIAEKRAEWRARRKYNEDWFFERFDHNW